MTMPEFDNPLDDALADFQQALDDKSFHNDARRNLVNGLRKIVQYTRDLESRVEKLENS